MNNKAAAALFVMAFLPTQVRASYSDVKKLSVVDSVVAPTALAVWSGDDYFLAQRDAADVPIISRVRKGTPEVWKSGIDGVSAMVVDERRAELYVGQARTVSAFKIKKLESEPTVYELPGEGVLSDIAFSIINREAYVVSAGDQTVWALRPKTKTASKLYETSDFEKLGVGKLVHILVSSDGRRIYLLSQEEKGIALIQAATKKKEIKVIARIADFQGPIGLDMYHAHFFIAEAETGHVRAFRIDDGEEGKVLFDAKVSSPPSLFSMDLHYALWIDRPIEDSPYRLATFPIKLQEK